MRVPAGTSGIPAIHPYLCLYETLLTIKCPSQWDSPSHRRLLLCGVWTLPNLLVTG